MAAPKILISGSGIAGSVFSFWLLRAYGNANITIVERAPGLRLTGASVDIRDSAVDIMKWMGMEQSVREQTTKESGIKFVRSDGSKIASLAASGREDVQSITSEFEIFRGALANIFIKPSLDKVNLIYGDHVTSFEHLGDGVKVTLASGKTDIYDLLVAADGIGSSIRGQLLGQPARDQIEDEGMHAAYFTVDSNLLKGSTLAEWYNATGGRSIFIRPDPDPRGRSRVMFANVTTSKQLAQRKKSEQAIRDGNETFMQLLEGMYKDAGWLAPEALKGMRESNDFYCSLFAKVKSPIFQKDRVVLVGDAGYATPGIGTSLAMIGGYVLAGELLNNPNDYGMALRRYEDIMRPFVKDQQWEPFDFMQLVVPQTQRALSIRNAILMTVDFLRIVPIMTTIMGLLATLGWKESKLKMPNYPWPQSTDELSAKS